MIILKHNGLLIEIIFLYLMFFKIKRFLMFYTYFMSINQQFHAGYNLQISFNKKILLDFVNYFKYFQLTYIVL